ncbi:MAG: VanW family protein [Clostridia bacterium]|nr:VanW family protein [Clostridia bacterium]
MKSNFFKSLFHNKYIVTGVALAVVIVLAAVFTAYGCVLINTDSIMDGVSVHNMDLSGKSYDEAVQMIAQDMQLGEDCEIKFQCGDTAFSLTPSQIELHADSEAIAQQAYDIGHSGNVFRRILDAYSAKFAGTQMQAAYTLNDTLLAASIEENLAEQVMPATPYSVEIEADALVVRNGTDGKGVAEQDIAQKICSDLMDGTADNVITLTISTIPAEPINFDEFCSEYIREAQDAQYTTNNGEYVFTPEVKGISFDIDAARAIIEDNVSNTQPYRIPAQITIPDVTVAQLQSRFAVDTLGTYTTNYSSSDANRASNVALAASKINGVVLNPGERFSFNGVVGPRTAAAGFKVAHVYVGDSVADGLGGGICQVSSTLYNAVLLADLKIVSRTNHSMPVGYVPLGRDATVSYGTIDFVFENNKKHPVTISATTYNRNLTVAIKGVDESDGTQIEIVTENAGYTAYTTKETIDASLAPGVKKVVKNGSNGSIYNSYKIYKKDGVVTGREHIARSNYLPIARVVAVGPAKAQPQQSAPVSAQPQQPPVKQPAQNVQPEKPAEGAQPNQPADGSNGAESAKPEQPPQEQPESEQQSAQQTAPQTPQTGSDANSQQSANGSSSEAASSGAASDEPALQKSN